jgi:hypothetical protein
MTGNHATKREVQHRADVINFHKKRKNSGLTFGLAVKK